MRRTSIAAAILLSAFCGSACDNGNPIGPTIVSALLELRGDLFVSNCFPAGIDESCDFEGEIENLGPDCATDVRGITSSFEDGVEVGRAAWLIQFDVRPGDIVLYNGTGLLIPPPPIDWTFDTEIFWTDVAC